MITSESFQALRRANPRTKAGFARSVEVTADAVRAHITAAPRGATASGVPRLRVSRARPSRRVAGISLAGVSFAAAAAVAVFLTIGSPASGPGIEDAAAAVKRAAIVTAASAERSGTAVVQITQNDELWAGKTVRWNGADVAIADNTPGRSGRPGDELLVVDGTLYGLDVDGSWVAMGSPNNIDPDSGTTPDEHLAAVREDVGGTTLRRITDGMTGLTTPPAR